MCDLINKVITSKLNIKNDRLILIYLIKQSKNTGNVTVSNKKIADDCKINYGTVTKRLRDLRLRGYITVQSNVADDGGMLANTYMVNADKL